MSAEWKTTRIEQHVSDGSGYEFTIVAVHDDEFGWDASVTITSRGMKHSDGAVRALRPAVARLLAMLPAEDE